MADPDVAIGALGAAFSLLPAVPAAQCPALPPPLADCPPVPEYIAKETIRAETVPAGMATMVWLAPVRIKLPLTGCLIGIGAEVRHFGNKRQVLLAINPGKDISVKVS